MRLNHIVTSVGALAALFFVGNASAAEIKAEAAIGNPKLKEGVDELIIEKLPKTPFDVFVSIDATAGAKVMPDRQPPQGKKTLQGVDGEDISTAQLDFTDGNARAGGRARVNFRKSQDPRESLKGKLQVKAIAERVDKTKDGSAHTTSIVNVDPPTGDFVALDGDRFKNDALFLFSIDPESSDPIFRNEDPLAIAGLSAMSTVTSRFFNGLLYEVGGSVKGTAAPTPFVTVAEEWQMFQIINFDTDNLVDSADFFGSSLTGPQLAELWGNYIAAIHNGGFGGGLPFGVWFVKRDVPVDQLGEWIWSATLAGSALVVPVPPTLVLVAFGMLGTLGCGRSWRRRARKNEIDRHLYAVNH